MIDTFSDRRENVRIAFENKDHQRRFHIIHRSDGLRHRANSYYLFGRQRGTLELSGMFILRHNHSNNHRLRRFST